MSSRSPFASRSMRSLAPRGAARTWDLALQLLAHLAETVVVVAIVGDLATTIASVVSRHFFNHPFVWTDDIGSICLSMIAFLGGPVAIWRGRGMSLTLLLERVPPRARAVVEAAGTWACLAFFYVLAKTFHDFLSIAALTKTTALAWPETVVAIWLVIGWSLFALFCADRLVRVPLEGVVGGVALAALAALPVVLIHGGGIYLLGYAFALTLLSGAPIALVLGLAALAFIEADGTIPISTMPVAFQSGIASFVLLAIPFFMLAGVLMDKGGLAARLVEMVKPVIARMPGGLLITQVIAVYIFAGVSGSKLADISAIGSVMRKPLEGAGYPNEESTAVLAAAAAMSETVPPSLPVIILASITALSPGALFLAGIAPAAAIALCLVIGILWRGRSGRYPATAGGSLHDFLRAVPPALPALALPVILVYGIVGGIGTPTEVSAFAALYGLVAAAFAYRSVSVRELWRALVDASLLSGITLLILGTANLMSQVITIGQYPQRIANALTAGGGKLAFLVLSALALIVIGSVLEGLPALLLFAPLLLPTSAALGISGLQYGIMLVVAQSIGAFAPPIGVGLYVASAIGGTTMEKVMRPSFFYSAVLVAGLAVVIAFPGLTTFLPHLLGH